MVVDKKGIAAGGSGAAGAFVSPKLGKSSVLHSLTNEAFAFAKDFYLKYSPDYFHQTGVVRIPKDAEDAQKFPLYQETNINRSEFYTKDQLLNLGISSNFESLFFPEAGDCDAKEVCQHLLKEIDFSVYEVDKVIRDEGLWLVGDYRAKNLILCTGYEENLIDIGYMGIRATWGTRGDFSTPLPLPISLHQSISVGANRDGVIKIGATHEKAIKVPQTCEESQAYSLQEKSASLVQSDAFILQKSYCGMRSGSRDYLPLVGKIIDVASMLERYPSIKRGKKFPFLYHENLYMMNGLGGRGFVFAPLLGETLAACIVDNKKVDHRINPDRLFLKWCRKLKA